MQMKIVMYSMKTVRDIGDYIFHYSRHNNLFKSPVNLVLYTSTKIFLRYTMTGKIHASVTSFLLAQSTKKGKADLIQALTARRKLFTREKQNYILQKQAVIQPMLADLPG